MKKTVLPGLLLVFLFGAVFAQEQVPNGDFENWETHALGFENPVGWDTPNASLFLTDTINVRRTDDAASGNNAVLLETIVVAVVFVTPGAITLGEFVVDYVNNTATFEGGVPFADRPLALNGSIKNFPAADDHSVIGIVFTKYNATQGQRDTIGGGLMTFPETYDSWTNFSIPIQFSVADDPDTMNIYAVSSNIYAPVDGGHMYLDKLTFEYEAGIDDINNVVETTIFPNPANDNIIFRFEKHLHATLNIFSNDGRQIYQGTINEKEIKVDVSGFAVGSYNFVVRNDIKKYSSGQFIISR